MRLALALLVTALLAGCSGGSKDTDGDGISNSLELEGWAEHPIDFMDRREAILMKSDPNKVDTDGDGVDDHRELLARTNPREKDTDGDGLTDCQELFHTVVEECEAPGFRGDVDGDGGYPTDPRNADSDAGPSRFKPTLPFDDQTGSFGDFGFGDGISDGDEILGYDVQLGGNRTIRVTSDPRNADSDGDGLEDGEERLYGGNPRVADTDGDGCRDGQDPWPSLLERYTVTVRTFHLHDAPQGDADVRIQVFARDRLQFFEDSHAVAAGENRTLDATLEVADPSCNLPAHDPWTRLRFIAFDLDNEVPIDVDSRSPARQLLWNVRTDELRWDDGASVVAGNGSATVMGAHATMTFDVAVTGP